VPKTGGTPASGGGMNAGAIALVLFGGVLLAAAAAGVQAGVRARD
jgi:hypothetical protein